MLVMRPAMLCLETRCVAPNSKPPTSRTLDMLGVAARATRKPARMVMRGLAKYAMRALTPVDAPNCRGMCKGGFVKGHG